MSYASAPQRLPYRPVVALELGINAAIFLALIEYWERYKDGNDMVYKSLPDAFIECGLSRTQQDAAIAILVRDNIIYYKLGRKNIRHFRINRDELNKLMYRVRKSNTQVCEKAARKSGRKPHTITLSNTFNTHKKYEHPRHPSNKGSPRNAYKGSTSHLRDELQNRYKYLRKNV